MPETRHYARWPIGYGDRQLDRGQIFALQGLPNDEKLLRIGYVAELPAGADVSRCLDCGEEFASSEERNAHARDRHSGRVIPVEREAEVQARREQHLLQVAPLYLDKTAASQK